MATKHPFDMGLDEIIEQDYAYDDEDVVNLENDISMEDEVLEPPPSVSSYVRKVRDPDVSVNVRLRPENIVDRPFGMPPIISRESQRQLQELEDLKAENRLHELSDRFGSRSNINGSMRSRAFSRTTTMKGYGMKNNSFARNYRNDAIGARSVKSEVTAGRDLRNRLTKVLDKKKTAPNFGKTETDIVLSNGHVDEKPGNLKNTVESLIQDKTIVQYVEIINKNFGRKYDIEIQRDIAIMQKKALVFSCGTACPVTSDGEGITGPKLMAIGTKITLNCRFS